MGKGNVNCNHFTGKKKPIGSKKKGWSDLNKNHIKTSMLNIQM